LRLTPLPGARETSICRPQLQRAEDIPPAAMEAGIKWRWPRSPSSSTRRELAEGHHYGVLRRHLGRPHVRDGQRAFEKPCRRDDLKAMERQVRDAIRAGAIGFTTSRSPAHETPNGQPVASRQASVGRSAPAGRP